MKLPSWMRVAMGATAAMNLVGAVAFLPPSRALRELGGFPDAAHPLYLTTVGLFIFIFGLAYAWVAFTGQAERLFVSVAAAGKLGFVVLLTVYWAVGLLPFKAVLSGTGDVLFAVLFLLWLYKVRTTVHHP